MHFLNVFAVIVLMSNCSDQGRLFAMCSPIIVHAEQQVRYSEFYSQLWSCTLMYLNDLLIFVATLMWIISVKFLLILLSWLILLSLVHCDCKNYFLLYIHAAWHQMVPICTEWWCTEANEATQTHCYNPVIPAYPIWAYYAHGRQCRCQEDPVSLPSGRLEKTTRLSPHHVAQHHPTGSETTPPYAPQSSRFGSEPPSVEDDVNVWRYAVVSCMPETTTNDV